MRAPQWEFTDPAQLPEDALADLQQVNQVPNAVDRLDERCRRLILMLFAEDDEKLPYDDVARQMGMSVRSIGPTRARCLEKLRQLFL